VALRSAWRVAFHWSSRETAPFSRSGAVNMLAIAIRGKHEPGLPGSRECSFREEPEARTCLTNHPAACGSLP
jgi:hypothetical protein